MSGVIGYARKAQNLYFWWLDKISKQAYIKSYPKYLRKLGIKISEQPGDCWISPTTFWDSAGYDLIEIGDDCTISFDTVILVHDYSINNAFRHIGIPSSNKHKIIKRPICIGNNCFIGARSIIMPGTVIEDNCIIGSGSVVRGRVAAGSVVCGNPAVAIGCVNDFAKKHVGRNDFEMDTR